MPRKSAHIKRSSTKSNLKIALLALAFCALLILSAKTFKFLYSLNQPISPNLTSATLAPISSDYSYNVALVAKDLSLVNIDPKNKKVTVLSIPDSTFMDIPKGFGQWPIISAYKIGQAENPKIGAELVSLSLQKLLGIPIDRVVVLKDGNSLITSKQLIEKWSGNPLISHLTSSFSETNLSPSEKFSLFSTISSTRADKLKFLDLYQTSITQTKLLPDSSRVLGVNKIKLDLFLRDEMFDPKIFSESIPVAIYNATDKPSLASDLARMITNLGGSVITVSNSAKTSKTSAVFTSDGTLKQTATFKRLSYLVAPNCLSSKCSFEDTTTSRSRGKIVVVLGQDYYLANY